MSVPLWGRPRPAQAQRAMYVHNGAGRISEVVVTGIYGSAAQGMPMTLHPSYQAWGP